MCLSFPVSPRPSEFIRSEGYTLPGGNSQGTKGGKAGNGVWEVRVPGILVLFPSLPDLALPLVYPTEGSAVAPVAEARSLLTILCQAQCQFLLPKTNRQEKGWSTAFDLGSVPEWAVCCFEEIWRPL